MNRDRSWLKDRRVWVLAVACLVVGFLIGMLIFGAPWHLQGAWGDVPTWFLVLLAAAAAWVGLSQLRAIQQQMAEEAKRNIKRDELLDKQLDEVDARVLAERRRQAEDVEVHWAGGATGAVWNNSRRPISAVTSKVMSSAGAHALAVPDNAGVLIRAPIPAVSYDFADSKPGAEWDRLRPGDRCGFTFPGLQVDSDQILVAWFTDDAGIRWQLDQYLHLVQAGDNDEYVP